MERAGRRGGKKKRKSLRKLDEKRRKAGEGRKECSNCNDIARNSLTPVSFSLAPLLFSPPFIRSKNPLEFNVSHEAIKQAWIHTVAGPSVGKLINRSSSTSFDLSFSPRRGKKGKIRTHRRCFHARRVFAIDRNPIRFETTYRGAKKRSRKKSVAPGKKKI